MCALNLKNHIRKNELGIQMIQSFLRKKIFGNLINTVEPISKSRLEESKYHLSKHMLWKKKISNYESMYNENKNIDEPAFPTPDITPTIFNLPPLNGKNVEEHFYNIGYEYSKPYINLINENVNANIPEMPSEWSFQKGWTKYEIKNNICEKYSVDYPKDKLLFFDVEVCMNDANGNLPTLAVALSKNNWYSWCSERLVKNISIYDIYNNFKTESKITLLSNLIPIGTDYENERLMIGHNVGYDRSFLKEQYYLKNDKLKFLDTLSLHVSLSGLTGYQRALLMSYKSNLKNQSSKTPASFLTLKYSDPSLWNNTGSLNSLKDVYKFYCNKELKKEARDIFVKGNLAEVRKNFQNLMQYCALDTLATFEVFKKQWKPYIENFPHPISLAGTLEMSTTYLPVKINNWTRYLESTQQTYDDLERELSACLKKVAYETCKEVNTFKDDPWLWNLDWSVQSVKTTKETIDKKKKKSILSNEKENCNLAEKINQPSFLWPYFLNFADENSQEDNNALLKISSNKAAKKSKSYLVGYPKWYRELCENPFSTSLKESLTKWEPGPCLISYQIRNVPKLLKLSWKGFALHYETNEGWGFLVPNDLKTTEEYIDGFPYKNYVKLIKSKLGTNQSCDEELLKSNINRFKKKNKETFDNKKLSSEIQMFGCTFYRLPHKDGIENKVGNPLSKSFMNFLNEGLLTSSLDEKTNKVLKISKLLSYWKNAGKRISSQMVCKKNENEIFGALLPRIIVAGTITRRAVEPTWLTASNAYEDRTGSELKGMIQAPDGYKFIGADVDSQELWIASLLGDSNFARIHGCTALGWMTLQGSKSSGTDMHSKVASLVGITREQAKVLNYGRIYGAGKTFAARFLKQSNPEMTEEEAKKKAETIYNQTKGKKSYETFLFSKKNFVLRNDDVTLATDGNSEKQVERKWVGGTESFMFNMLEEIAKRENPKTPVLNCSISSSLTNQTIRKDFITSVINWVVQSSGVDYLHLMLISMNYLKNYYNLNGRFSISIHDEVRYIFEEKDQYKAAFILQITNLLTRAIFCSKLKMYDLPMSVAFFSSVDIDTVLRKEVDMDCKTVSNPHGLKVGYNIPFGESLTMHQILDKTDVHEIAKLTNLIDFDKNYKKEEVFDNDSEDELELFEL